MYGKKYLQQLKAKREGVKRRRLNYNKYDKKKNFQMLQSFKADESYGKAEQLPDITREELTKLMDEKFNNDIRWLTCSFSPPRDFGKITLNKALLPSVSVFHFFCHNSRKNPICMIVFQSWRPPEGRHRIKNEEARMRWQCQFLAFPTKKTNYRI